jgi:predicted lipoprotein with Yx(FWY)xxD motif
MTMKSSRWLVPALAAGLLLAGCSKTDDATTNTGGGASTSAAPTTKASSGGGTDYGDKSYPTPTTASGGATGTTAGGPNAAGKIEIKTATSSLGEILVDGNGMTLYVFKTDTGSTSKCAAGCATVWPPVIGTAEAGSSLDAASFSTTARDDGAKQITYKGHPLYHFSGDKKAGDTVGQGTADVWYVVGTDGNPIEKKV